MTYARSAILAFAAGAVLALAAMPTRAADIAPNPADRPNLCMRGTPPNCPYRYSAVERDSDGYLARDGEWFIRFDEKGQEKYRLVDPATKGR